MAKDHDPPDASIIGLLRALISDIEVAIPNARNLPFGFFNG
jgi:hypothetical protein